jgi:NAD(P)-dependent dehydrogenase (short-subunit alcohol dehydrogenase family)
MPWRANREALVATLVDKVVLVTGVARGCGKVLAEAFAADGAKVVGCDTDVDAGRATAVAVRAAGGEMTFVEADVADDTAVEELVARTAQTYGGLDCAVNNAGTEATGLIADSDDEVFDRLIASTSRACCRASDTRFPRCGRVAGGRSSTCPRSPVTSRQFPRTGSTPPPKAA